MMEEKAVGDRFIPWIKTHFFLVGCVLGAMCLLIVAIFLGNFSSFTFGRIDGDSTASGQIDLLKNVALVKNHNVSSQTIPRDPPTLKLWVQEENKAEIEQSLENPEVTRVNIKKARTTDSWHIQLNHTPLVVQGEEWYSLRFKARADEVRNMLIAVTQAHDPWIALGPYHEVSLMQEWQDFEMEFKVTADDDHARVSFYLGGWAVPVEIAGVRLLQLSHGIPKWWLKLEEGNEAGLGVPPEHPEMIRVEIAQVKGNKTRAIQLLQKSLPVQAKDHYLLGIQARADIPRSIKVAVSQADYPWKGIGLTRTLQLGSEWEYYEMDFVATQSEGNAQIHFGLGGEPVSVEIGDVILRRMLSGKPLWRVRGLKGNHAELVVKPNTPDIMRVAITRAHTTTMQDIQLHQWPIVVEAEGRYSVQFRARADFPRTMAVGVSQSQDPTQHLGLYQTVLLTQAWQTFSLEFIANEADEHAQLHFDLGGRMVSVEIAAVEFQKLSQGTPRWVLDVQEGNQAELVVNSSKQEVLRVVMTHLDTALPQHVQLKKDLVQVQGNNIYALEFRARADLPRTMMVGVSQSQDPTQHLGLYQSIPLTQTWQIFSLEFTAPRSVSHARIHFDLGGETIPVELMHAKLHLRSEVILSSSQSIHASPRHSN